MYVGVRKNKLCVNIISKKAATLTGFSPFNSGSLPPGLNMYYFHTNQRTKSSSGHARFLKVDGVQHHTLSDACKMFNNIYSGFIRRCLFNYVVLQ